MLIPIRFTNNGSSIVNGEDESGTTSGVNFSPSKQRPIPEIIINIGDESDVFPNELRSGHNLASLRGKDAKPSIPNGHQIIAGPGIGNRCGRFTPCFEAIHFWRNEAISNTVKRGNV